MQSRYRARRDVLEHRQMQDIGVEMQNVELVRSLTYLVERDHVVGDCVAHCRIKTQGPSRARNQLGGSDGISACEQRNLMPLLLLGGLERLQKAYNHRGFQRIGPLAINTLKGAWKNAARLELWSHRAPAVRANKSIY